MLEARQLAAVPEGLDAAAAETVVVNGVTAWRMLHRTARVKEGQTIVVLGAAWRLRRARKLISEVEQEVLVGLTATERRELLALLRRALEAAPAQPLWSSNDEDQGP